MRDSSCDACVIGVAGLECIRSSSEGNFVWETWKCSQEIRFKTRVSARTIILRNRAPGTCMSSYRCHRPGNASDRARMKTFSFRLGDIFVSSERLGWRWFRVMTLGNRARMKTFTGHVWMWCTCVWMCCTCIELGGKFRLSSDLGMVSSDGVLFCTCIELGGKFRLGD